MVTASNGNQHLELIIGDAKVREITLNFSVWSNCSVCRGFSVLLLRRLLAAAVVFVLW